MTAVALPGLGMAAQLALPSVLAVPPPTYTVDTPARSRIVATVPRLADQDTDNE